MNIIKAVIELRTVTPELCEVIILITGSIWGPAVIFKVLDLFIEKLFDKTNKKVD